MLHWRLGISEQPGYCRNWNASRKKHSGQLLAHDHAALCPCGPTRNHRHKTLLDTGSDTFEEAGGTVRQEVYAACSSTPLAEAYLDIQVHGLPELEGPFFDVTVRHPRDARYAPNLCAAHDGTALQRASAEKQARYPSCPQGRVVPPGSETWGRLSEEGEHILALCAASAARRDHRSGRLASSARLRR